ncbi:hypothetical protein KJ765_00860 [Candidatus Micrarchaeota archaeon]|nr:hypothetical protein [Candidatus Micrarchaeota archaeon]
MKRKKKRETKEFQEIGAPLIRFLKKKGWKEDLKKRSSHTGAHGWDLEFTHKGRRYVIEIMGKHNREHGSFVQTLGELVWRDYTPKSRKPVFKGDAIRRTYYRRIALAFWKGHKAKYLNKIRKMPTNWRKIGKTFNCRFVFFVDDRTGEVDMLKWNQCLRG